MANQSLSESVLSATENVLINQSKLTSRNVAKEALSCIMRCCNFTGENHKVDDQKFCYKYNC